MTDAEVEALGVRYRALMEEARRLRWDIVEAIDAVRRDEVDCAFGRELVAALGNLESMPDV